MGEPSAPVTVVVPVLDGEAFIEAALRSVLAGSLRPDEVIVVDDGSRDRSASVAERVPGVRVVRQAHAGVAAARNLGAAQASHGLLAFHDADDLRTRHGLAAQVAEMVRRPEVGCVIGRQDVIVEPGTTDLPWWADGPERAGLAAVGQMLVRRSTFDRVGGFADGVHLEDVDWLVRARACGVVVSLIEEPVVVRRAHSTNRSADLTQTRAGTLDILRRRMAAGRRAPPADDGPGPPQPVDPR